jgi:archaellum biogenesis protein FlaJ (TadC family)
MRGRSAFVILLALILVVGAFTSAVGSARAQSAGIVISPINPGANSTIADQTPTIEADYSDSVGAIIVSSVVMYVDKGNVTGTNGFNASSSKVTYAVPSILALRNGNHTIRVFLSDTTGNSAEYSWNFTVNTNLTPPGKPLLPNVSPIEIVLIIGITAAIIGGSFGGYILYLKQTTRFTFRKYFILHPVKNQVYTIYIPAAAAFVFTLFGLSYVYSNPQLPWIAQYYVFVAAIFIALTAFGVDARRQMQRVRSFERAFAQFLFELADAMRGGLDPAKAIVELSKTSSNVLKKPLRVAADGIRVGRPFEAVLRTMVSDMESPLIRRYAALIADATTVGGETAIVVYRAAKDMDDFVKIDDEREKALFLPVAVIYIAFAVLMAVLFSLVYLAPTLGTLNVSIPGGTSLFGGGTVASTVPKLTQTTLEERFLELMIINALGTGAIIGAFTEGRARYGILHALGLTAAALIAFVIIFPPG